MTHAPGNACVPPRSRCSRGFIHGLLALALAGCTTTGAPAPELLAPSPAESPARPVGHDAGVLVMAHGGGAEWNARVDEALAPVQEQIPLTLALGMADPNTLQAALDSLHDQGVRTVAVVRLFISGASFRHQTEYLFGLRADPPARAMVGHRMAKGTELPLLQLPGRILFDQEGLAGSSQVTQIITDRADANAPGPAGTGVLLIAHGMGAEDENDSLLSAMEDHARKLRSRGYPEVQVATLREDWAAARIEAEQQIREAVAGMGERWDRVVVIPYRLFGFGPYANVLEGHDYVPTQGLLPHPLITNWVTDRVTASFCGAGLASPLEPCPVAAGPGVQQPRQSADLPIPTTAANPPDPPPARRMPRPQKTHS